MQEAHRRSPDFFTHVALQFAPTSAFATKIAAEVHNGATKLSASYRSNLAGSSPWHYAVVPRSRGLAKGGGRDSQLSIEDKQYRSTGVLAQHDASGGKGMLLTVARPHYYYSSSQ